MEVDSEVGTEEQQLSTDLMVESKETGKKKKKKRTPPKRMGWWGRGLRIKSCSVMKTFCPLAVC